jgi:rubrerythrin
LYVLFSDAFLEKKNKDIICIMYVNLDHTIINGAVALLIKNKRCSMVLKEKEKTIIQDLQTQEKNCIEKYDQYSSLAKDQELKSLFQTLKQKEEQHYQSLGQVLSGTVPESDCNDSDGMNYNPTATYGMNDNSEDKKTDCFLATDCIGTEKLVSSEYNSDVFTFDDSKLRKLLADIQVEEQNHAEMLWKYKTVNGMA